MVSKTLVTSKQVVGKTSDTTLLQQRYDKYMERVKSGMESNIYQMGDRGSQRAFMAQVLSAGITGKKLALETGKSQRVPDLCEDNQGRMSVTFVDYGESEMSLDMHRAKRIQQAEMMQASVLNMDGETDDFDFTLE